MAKYKVQGPDGAIHVFEGPDGATQDQVLAFAQQHFGQQKPAAPAIDPKEFAADDPGVMMSALIGAGWTTDRVIKGMQQLYHGAKSKVESPTLSSLVTGETESGKALRELKEQADEEARLYKPLQDKHPIATAVGEAAPGMVIPAGGGATAGAALARLAVAGAVPRALEHGSAFERIENAAGGAAGSVVGGFVAPKVAGAVMKAVPAIGRAGRALVEPFTEGGRTAIAGRALNKAAGDEAPDVITRLRAATEAVPGSLPTVGQVSENGGLAALERAAAAGNPSAFTVRAKEQAAARLNALRGIAQDEPARAAAVAAREGATKDLYGQATRATYEMDPQLQRLLETPAMQQALAKAKTLAENNQRPFAFEVPGHDVMGGLANRTATNTTQITGQGLQDLKMAIDSMLADPASGYAGAAGNAVKGLRGQLLNWMENRNPAFKQARTTYADMSKPIGQMDIGQQLVQKLEPALNDYGALGSETANKFTTALRNADQTARQATKFKGAGMDDIMSPEQLATLEGVASDLARKANSEKLGRGPGSDTTQKLLMQNLVQGNVAERSGSPKLIAALPAIAGTVAGGLTGGVPGAIAGGGAGFGLGKVAKAIYGSQEEKIGGKIADALLDPAQAAELMVAHGLRPPVPWQQTLLGAPRAATQLIGGGAGMSTANLFAQ